MRHYKRKTEPVPMAQCPLYLREGGRDMRILCEAEPPAVRISLAFPNEREMTAWSLTHCKSKSGYKDCWIFQDTERRYK